MTEEELRRELRGFAAARPGGWNHEDWVHFLEDLQSRGHNINDREQIGVLLENERLDLALDAVKGMGPRRRRSVIEHYGMVWRLRKAPVDEIARVASIPRELAEQVRAAVGG